MKNLLSFFRRGLNDLFYAGFALVTGQNGAAPADNGLSKAPGVDITINGLVAIFFSLACYATKVILVVMVIMILWYGLRMMASQGDPGAFKKARSSLGYAVIGMLVILGANTIIDRKSVV